MVYCVIVLLIFVAEILIKDYVERHFGYAKEKSVLNGKVSLTKQYNKGACMNFLEKKEKLVQYISTSMLATVILFFLVQLPRKGRHLLKLGLSFVIGGALSNVCDRLRKGHVVDYIIINCKRLRNVVFNMADVFIFLGAAIISLVALFGKKNK